MTEPENDTTQNQMVAQELYLLKKWHNPEYMNVNMSCPIQLSISDPVYPPRFGPYVNTSNTVETSSIHPLKPSMLK